MGWIFQTEELGWNGLQALMQQPQKSLTLPVDGNIIIDLKAHKRPVIIKYKEQNHGQIQHNISSTV